ncbi:hypothetical protein [Dyadobacter psychrotolerans]|uniref:Uncharacterized protein n=1 Tax=Dyadobacter psychrotolerans TaxID=2541721 RepID=A0A4R5E1Q9_9BACT|nr:hypothetical protein [Dyadobacter psychrotolerans]TDE18015.1 hypothetical protein E0F88_00205 [Dyadobacter psychrotolerans]
MTKQEADQLIKEATTFIGSEKPVATDGQLGFPSVIEVCLFENTLLVEENGNFFPKARMISTQTGLTIRFEDLNETLEYLRHNHNRA